MKEHLPKAVFFSFVLNTNVSVTYISLQLLKYKRKRFQFKRHYLFSMNVVSDVGEDASKRSVLLRNTSTHNISYKCNETSKMHTKLCTIKSMYIEKFSLKDISALALEIQRNIWIFGFG